MNLGMAIAEMDLDYVVITSVDRDDVADFGASHFANCIQQSRIRSPKTKVEVLIPDFGGDIELLRRVVDAGPEVVAHNIETVERLTWPTRDRKASYGTSMKVLADIKRIDPNKLSKSSIMVGLGETVAEVRQCMKDLRSQGCDFLTVGQYLQPTKKHLLVDEFIHPDQFKAYEEMGKDLGFEYVASGPLVRSSYKAGEYYISNFINQRRENV